MPNEKITFDKLSPGMHFEGKDCILSKQKDAVDFISGVLIDETGELDCFINKQLMKDTTLFANTDVVVKVSASYTKRSGKNLLWITAIERSDAKIARPASGALNEERIHFYTEWIKTAASRVKNPGYQALIKTCVTADYIKELSELPATLARGGQYQGGALQMTATVLRFIAQVGSDYVRFGNEAYTLNFNWDALITATLLQFYGNRRYYYFDEESGKVLKTDYGLHNGYLATLDMELQKVILENKLPVSEADFAILCNILGASVRDGKNGVRAVTAEGTLLKAMNDAFVSLDMYNAEYARLTKENIGPYGKNVPYLYSDPLDAYIVVGRRKVETENPDGKEG